MPELPEVETVKSGLNAVMHNQVIQDCVVTAPKLRFEIPDFFTQTLTGAHIQRLSRRAKYMVIHTNRGEILWHLGMSGSFTINDDQPPAKHDHIHITLKNGTIIRYRDPRRFGFVDLKQDISTSRFLENLGQDAWPNKLPSGYLFEKLRRKSVAIKQAILDQTIVGGIGNIYASESLFHARLHPQEKASSLSRRQCDKLSDAMHTILQRAVDVGGSTLRNHAVPTGDLGCFQHEFSVYNQHNTPCKVCGTVIEKITQQGRSTFFCSRCQKASHT